VFTCYRWSNLFFLFSHILFHTSLNSINSTDKSLSSFIADPSHISIHCGLKTPLHSFFSKVSKPQQIRQNGSKSFSLGKVRRHLGCNSLSNRQGQHHHHGLRLGRLNLRHRHDLVRRQPASAMVRKTRGKGVQFILYIGRIHTVERVAVDYALLCNVKSVVGATGWKRNARVADRWRMFGIGEECLRMHQRELLKLMS